MTPPIFVYDSGDLDIFRSVEAAEGYVEAPQVLHGRCVAYDSLGRVLKLTSPNSGSDIFFGIRTYNVDQRIKIVGIDTDPSHEAELCDLLRTYLARVGVPRESISRTALDGLVAIAVERLGFTA